MIFFFRRLFRLLDISPRNAFFLPFFFMDHKVRERRPLGLYKEICIMLRGPSSVGTSIRNGNAFVMQMQKVVILLLLFYLYIRIYYTGTPSIYIVLCFYATSSFSSSSAPSALTHTHTHTQSLLRPSPFATRQKNATDCCCYYKIINYNIAQKCAMRRCRA